MIEKPALKSYQNSNFMLRNWGPYSDWSSDFRWKWSGSLSMGFCQNGHLAKRALDIPESNWILLSGW